ncbi:MAG TPA: PAS domain-containing protein [Verrucomicrobiota bacterium]|nr:PAS domain-containing protein [Verrucomicrobiota bacterium]
MLYPEPHFSYVAPSSTKIIGYTPEEHYADSELLFKIIHPEDKLILKKVFKELNPSDTPIVIRYVHKDGHTVWTEMVISPIYNSDRKITGFDSISRDITEQKILEEDKEKAILELEKALFEIKTLQGLIPICAGCKKIRNDKDYWENIEIYLKQHLDVQFTHGLCPDCIRKYYPEYVNEIEKQNKHTSGNNN